MRVRDPFATSLFVYCFDMYLDTHTPHYRRSAVQSNARGYLSYPQAAGNDKISEEEEEHVRSPSRPCFGETLLPLCLHPFPFLPFSLKTQKNQIN